MIPRLGAMCRVIRLGLWGGLIRLLMWMGIRFLILIQMVYLAEDLTFLIHLRNLMLQSA